MRKKLIICIIMTCVLAGYAPAAMTELNFEIQEGWNLVPFNTFDNISDNGEIQLSNFKYGFIYDLDEKDYILSWKDNDWTNEVRRKYNFQRGEDHWLLYSSMWIYSDKAGNMKLWQEGGGDVSMFKLRRGWNFIFVIPAMNELTFDDMKGNCDVEKAYIWNNKIYSGHISPTWENIYRGPGESAKFSLQHVGYGFIIKVSVDCTLSSPIIQPPAIPT